MYRLYAFIMLCIMLLWSLAVSGMTNSKDRLVDMPVSNHGARIRLILQRCLFIHSFIHLDFHLRAYTF